MLMNALSKRTPLSTSASQFLGAFQQRFFGYRPEQETIKRWNIVKDDTVQMITGRHKNATGKVLKVYRKTNMVLV